MAAKRSHRHRGLRAPARSARSARRAYERGRGPRRTWSPLKMILVGLLIAFALATSWFEVASAPSFAYTERAVPVRTDMPSLTPPNPPEHAHAHANYLDTLAFPLVPTRARMVGRFGVTARALIALAFAGFVDPPCKSLCPVPRSRRVPPESISCASLMRGVLSWASVITLVVFVALGCPCAYAWSLSMTVLNALMHAINGNMLPGSTLVPFVLPP